MSDKKKKDENEHKAADYTPPKGSQTEHSLKLQDGGKLEYKASADWVVLRKNEKPVAEVFHVAYTLKKSEKANGQKRPVTFIFNGGPGAASAYLHMGACGPRRVGFNDNGTTPAPPARLVDNTESWLSFTDLVFVDPVGTGFSRTVADPDKKDKDNEKDKDHENTEYYALNKDLQSLGEFMQRFLSEHNRWLSPVFIAGESYGGFRVGRMVKMLQEGFGIGLNGAILISPALEWYYLDESDYDLSTWINLFPTMVLTAVHHGRSRSFTCDQSIESICAAAEQFAVEKLVLLLAQGASMPETQRNDIYTEMESMLGLPVDFLKLSHGRMNLEKFCRNLLRDQQRWVGLYDGTVTAVDPFPDREHFEGADPTLYGIERLFCAGVNTQLRDSLKVKTDREYHLLSEKVFHSWKIDQERHAFDSYIGATDELRYGMALNPHTKVYITHGLYDLVTPYFASNRLVNYMRLDPQLEKNLTLKHYHGGHMFYAWEASRKALQQDMQQFYQSATGGEPEKD